MIARRHRVFLWAGLLIGLNWLTLIVIAPEPGLTLGYLFGSLFAQTTIAAGWAAFGPGRVIWRVPLSLIWVLLLVAIFCIALQRAGGPDEFAVFLGRSLFGQYLALQFPFLAAAFGFGLHLCHVDELSGEMDRSQLQFGIRQLMIITALAATVFGIGRFVVLTLPPNANDLLIFIFLAVAAIVLSLPLFLAGLMRRLVVPGLALTALLLGIMTYWELPLLERVHGGGSGPGTADLISINVLTAAITSALIAVVRANGYRLYLGRRNAQ